MSPRITLRRAQRDDIGALDRLFQRSYARLLAPDYPPSVLIVAVPVMARAQHDLVASGLFYVAEDEEGQVLGAGGWSRQAPGGRPSAPGTGHVRHVATDPEAVRRGVGRLLLGRIVDEARTAGLDELQCISTRTAEPFYAAMGFTREGETEVTLRPGIAFPAVCMWRAL